MVTVTDLFYANTLVKKDGGYAKICNNMYTLAKKWGFWWSALMNLSAACKRSLNFVYLHMNKRFIIIEHAIWYVVCFWGFIVGGGGGETERVCSKLNDKVTAV